MTQAEIRKAFWAQTKFKKGYKRVGSYRRPMTQNEYPTDVRVEFCDFVNSLDCDEAVKQRVTL